MTQQNYKLLKYARSTAAACFFVFMMAYLLHNFDPADPDKYTWLTSTQFMPSLLKIIAAGLAVYAVAGLILIVLFTFIFGRVYCSLICPLGILQDIIGFFKRLCMPWKKHAYKTLPKWLKLRTAIVVVCAGTFLFGLIFPVMLLDPFSFFGRINTNLFRPAYLAFSNIAAKSELMAEYFGFEKHEYLPFTVSAVIFALSTLTLLTAAVILYGRIYCNSVCPVGSILGAISKYSLLKVKIDPEKCRSCGICENSCKAGCIEYMEHQIDASRCVMCFNCTASCPFDAMTYGKGRTALHKPPVRNEVNAERREFMTVAGIMTLTLPIMASPLRPPVKTQSKSPVMPPGAGDYRRFNGKCTSCHLCVSACPSNIIKPSLTAYGLTNLMQPQLDYSKNYCKQDCNVCSLVCPTGALLPQSNSIKKRLQIGLAEYTKARCIVITEKTYCGACAEACPRNAIKMVEYNNFSIPQVDPIYCIGCGACEKTCPARPVKAIRVGGVSQQKITPPLKVKKVEEEEDGFPF